MEFVENKKNIKILTENGFQSFDGILLNTKEIYEIKLDNNLLLKCTYDHKLFSISKNKFSPISKLEIGEIVKCKNNNGKIISIEKIEKNDIVCDLINVDNTHSYYTNDILSHNCAYFDEFAFVQRADEFFASSYPVITSGKDSKAIIISTPCGIGNMYEKLWKDAIQGKNEFYPFEAKWTDVPGRDDKFRESTIRNIGIQRWNQEFLCHFLGSSDTLIDGAKLRNLSTIEPQTIFNDIKIFHEPLRNHQYILTLDTAEAKGQNNHAFIVFDITQFPYKVVASFTSNKLPLYVLADYVVDVAKKYNGAEVLVEIMSTGQEVAKIIHHDLQYERLIRVTQGRNKSGQTVSNGFIKNPQFGVKMSRAVKKIGCMTIKNMIEGDKLIINDKDIILELATFVKNASGYAAEKNKNDDLVMCLVSFAWLFSQKYFRDVKIDSEKDLVNEFRKEFNKNIETIQNNLPKFYYVDGEEIPVYEEQGMLWTDIFISSYEN